MNLGQVKAKFLTQYNPGKDQSVAVSKAIAAAVQHNTLYRPDCSQSERSEVRATWSRLLTEAAQKYVEPQTVETYEFDFLSIRESMNATHGTKFRNVPHPRYKKSPPGFRVSHAQKSLSVYLKHLWCIGFIVEPPSCPVDRIILERVGLKYDAASWGVD